MLDITVCILSYNRANYLKDAVNSVLAQTVRPNKIIICDNASGAHVFEEVKSLLGELVEWVGADSNHPFIWNFTRAMSMSQTTFTMMLHDDDRLNPDFLERQLAYLDAHHSVGAISANGYLIDELGHRAGNTLSKVSDDIDVYRGSGQVAIKYAGDSCIPFSPTVYRTEIARRIKLRPDFGKVCDATFFCDLADVSQVAYQNLPLYECRVHEGQDSAFFPDDIMQKLEDFFISRVYVSDKEKESFLNLSNQQKAIRFFKIALFHLKNKDWNNFYYILNSRKFRIVSLIQALFKRVVKKIWN